MRTANLLVALGLLAFGVAVLVQSQAVGTGWNQGAPQSGFFPFWLGVMLVLLCLVLLGQIAWGWRGEHPPFVKDRQALASVGKVGGTALGALVLVGFIGFYAASAVYLFVYTKWVGRYRWHSAILISLGVTIGTYLIFERWLLILLPRGESSPLAVSAEWDGGAPEVEHNLEAVFPGLTLGIKLHGTTLEALGRHFMISSFLVLGALSLLLSGGIWLTFRNVSRQMELARLKSDFVSNVSHELRTPLSLIRLYAETLEMGRVTAEEKRQEYFRIIRKESERLSAMINNILDFSRIEAGRKEYDFRETNIAELVRNTLESYRYQIEQHGFTFEEEIADDLPRLRVDREAIARSLLNLVNNALKYSADDKFLRVSLYRENGSVKLEVLDHGIGVPRGEQRKIFEKFYRAGDPMVHNTKGSGLGLSLVRHIVEAHQGEIRVDSVPGQGSRFVITLPIHPPAPDGAQAA